MTKGSLDISMLQRHDNIEVTMVKTEYNSRIGVEYGLFSSSMLFKVVQSAVS